MKHVTPSVPTCFWCRKVKPLRLVTKWYSAAHDYEPCPDCKKLCQRGVFVIEVTNQPNAPGQPCLTPQMTSVFPTGKWAVVQRAAALYMKLPQDAVTKGVMTVSKEGFAQIMNYQNEARVPTLAQIAGQRQLLPLPETMH